jgi:hypothetical protein
MVVRTVRSSQPSGTSSVREAAVIGGAATASEAMVSMAARTWVAKRVVPGSKLLRSGMFVSSVRMRA